jgi:hypothetical protein
MISGAYIVDTCTQSFGMENGKARDDLKDIDIDGRVILKRTFEK